MTEHFDQSAEMDERFLSRKNLISAGWVIIIGIAAFIGGLFVSWIKGPTIVEVASPTANSKPIIVRLEPDVLSKESALISHIAALTEELKHIREFHSLPGKLNQIKPAALSEIYNRLQIPRFVFPKELKQWKLASMNGLIQGDCPQILNKRNQQIVIAFDLFEQSLPGKTTPLLVRIDEILSKDKQVSVLEYQYEFHQGHNQILLSVSLSPAKYQLEYGFYLLSELGKETPEFYSMQCPMTIQ